MIEGPFPLDPADGTKTIVPLERPYLTPRIGEQRVALRVSAEDHEKAMGLGRARGRSTVITDIDTGIRYRWETAPCSLPRCHCDATITTLQ